MRAIKFGLIPAVVIAVAPKGLAEDSPPKIADPFLIYYDGSPGGVVFAQLWKQIASAPPNQPPVFSRSVEDFADKLASRTWRSVIVINKRTQGEPAYANSLRNYATKHADRVVQLFVWDDQGDRIGANSAVLGTTAISVWLRGNTTTAYALSRNSLSDEAIKAHTNPSLLFPDFNGVLIAPCDVVGPSTEGSTDDGPQVNLAGPTPCLNSCFENFQNHANACFDDFMRGFDECYELYGAHGDDQGDPVQLSSCLGTAANDYSACLAQASRAYSRCLLVCQRRSGPINPQPANPPPR